MFTSRLGKAYTAPGLRSIMRRRGGITAHQLRHTFAQVASEQVERDVLSKLLGHEHEDTARFYV